MSDRTVVFVCLHGAAKSLIAATLFQRLADERKRAGHVIGMLHRFRGDVLLVGRREQLTEPPGVRAQCGDGVLR